MLNRRVLRVLIIAVLGIGFVALSFLLLQTAATQAQIDQPRQLVCFVSAGQSTCVDRVLPLASTTITDQVRALTQQLIAGPTSIEKARGVQSALPGGTQLGQMNATERQVSIGLILPDDFLRTLTDDQVEDINAQFQTTFTPFNFQRLEIDARGSVGGYRLLSDFLPKIEIPRKSPSSVSMSLPLTGVGRGGGLSNKTVFVSAGHGWYWYSSSNQYITQRPVYPDPPFPAGEGVVEDFNNAEAVNQYLLPYLWNAGADAWTVRERDMNPNMLIVDDGDAAFTTQGSWSLNAGGYGGSYRSTTTVAASPTATATWTFIPPITDTYAVYVHFPGVGDTRTVDARFFVEHAGAVTPMTITQARDGDNWRFIGRYPFYGGRSARLWLTNQSNTPGLTVLADAIRIGGGIGDVQVVDIPTGVLPPPSGKPRWEEQARQYAKWVGLPNMPNVDNLNDVIVRPIYSDMEYEAGEDAAYVAWHTNGLNGYNTTIRGTTSYVYVTPTQNSILLQNSIHTQLLNDIHAGWDQNWPDLRQRSLDLGELRLLTTTLPGVLIENGYHDNPIDVEALKDPRFMQLSARAIYHGLVNYWHALDPNVPLIYLPEPPQQVIMRNTGPGQITIGWQPAPTDGTGPLGDAATSYRVYTSTDGFGWSNPIDVATTAYTLTNLAPNQLIFVKVSGVNAGGESFTSPVLAARTPTLGSAPVLIVYGFERIDKLGDTQQYDPPEGLSRRVFIDRINRFDYIIQHAQAITLPFDSAMHAAVSNGSIELSRYAIVDWIAGEEQNPFPSLTTNDQTALTNFLNSGGALLISGAKIGYEAQGTPFYANTLHASFAGSNAGTYAATSTASGIFSSLGTINFDDGTHGTYNVDQPDSFNPVNGAVNALVYNTGAPAAVQYVAGACTRLVYMGIPFETIYPETQRRAMMSRMMSFFSPCLAVEAQITSPLNQALLNGVPPFSGIASSNATGVQVSIRRVSDAYFYNGSSFVNQPEIWLTASGTGAWSYPLPALADGEYALRGRATASSPIVMLPPAAVTFTLDTIPPAVPTLITPTNGITLLAVAPKFEWASSGDAVRFILEVDGITTTLENATPGATQVVTDGSHIWRVRAVDAAGNQSDWSSIGQFSTTSLKAYLPLVLRNDKSSPACYDAIVNGGFETGDFAGWTRPSQNPPGAVVAATVYSGNYAARIGAATISDPITTTSYSSILQSLDIPANVLTATLSFARYRWSSDTAGDREYVAILRTGLPVDYLFSEGAADLNWNVLQFDLKGYAGQTIDLLFSVKNDGLNGSSGMAIDDVQTHICLP